MPIPRVANPHLLVKHARLRERHSRPVPSSKRRKSNPTRALLNIPMIPNRVIVNTQEEHSGDEKVYNSFKLN